MAANRAASAWARSARAAQAALFQSEHVLLEPAVALGQRPRDPLDRDDVQPDAEDHGVISTLTSTGTRSASTTSSHTWRIIARSLIR